MTKPVGCYGGSSACQVFDPTQACFDDSLGRLSAATDRLQETEKTIESALTGAVLRTLETAALCLGSVDRLQSTACIGAATRQVQALLALDELAERYEEEAAEYESALAEHLACLSGR